MFWECTFPPLVEIRESPEFHDLMREDKAHWPRCLLWHGWFPMISGVHGASPWAADASESACYMVEVALERYSSDLLAGWVPSDEYDEVEAASSMPDHPNVWTDGSLVFDRVRPEGPVHSCKGFCSVPGFLQSVQRAEMWGVILALQSSSAVHLGVDNLGVVRHVGRLLASRRSSVPFELVQGW